MISHLGRPKAREMQYSLKPVFQYLQKFYPYITFHDIDYESFQTLPPLADMVSSQIAIIENIRFSPAETSKKDLERIAFAKWLTSGFDAYIGDGFACVHRKHASVYEAASFLPSAPGLLVEKEINSLGLLFKRPKDSFALILGGSKISDKIGIIDNLMPRVSAIFIGGGMAFTFLKALGYKIAQSIFEEEYLDVAASYLRKAKEMGVQIFLPIDFNVVGEVQENAMQEFLDSDALDQGTFGEKAIALDIGPKTIDLYSMELPKYKTCFWNGPMGMWEIGDFRKGTESIARAVSKLDVSVIGGGDCAAAVKVCGFTKDDFYFLSTGGGAALEFLEGKELPGLAALGILSE